MLKQHHVEDKMTREQLKALDDFNRRVLILRMIKETKLWERIKKWG